MKNYILKIEENFGRIRKKKNEARILDLDIIDYKQEVNYFKNKFVNLSWKRSSSPGEYLSWDTNVLLWVVALGTEAAKDNQHSFVQNIYIWKKNGKSSLTGKIGNTLNTSFKPLDAVISR